MLSVKGVYEDGVARPLTPVQAQRGQQVIITFLEDEVSEAPATADPLAEEEAAFVAMHASLLQQYEGQYVAIHGGQLVDHDRDLEVLSLRLYAQFGDQPVWVAPVRDTPTEAWSVRSPRWDHPT